MNVGALRKVIADLPDEMELVGEAAYGQQDILYAAVCTHQYDGMHQQERDRADYLESQPNFYPDRWEELDKPTLKIALRY